MTPLEVVASGCDRSTFARIPADARAFAQPEIAAAWLAAAEKQYFAEPCSEAATTGRIAPGQTRSGRIEVAEDADWFRISLTEGQLYTFDLRGRGRRWRPARRTGHGLV